MIDSFYNQKFPILEVDESIFLREQHVKDAEAFFHYYTHSEVTRYILATKPSNLTEAASEIHYCRELFKSKKGIYWTIACKKDNRMIGAIGLYINNQHHRAEICYDLSREYWNRGIMTRAIMVIVNFCFHYIGIHRIEAITLKENAASKAVLKKVGFIHEGTLRNYRLFNSQSHDVEMFAITPEIISSHKLATYAHPNSEISHRLAG